MPPDDQAAIDRLADALDRLADDGRGSHRLPRDAAELAGTHRRLRERDRTPGPDAAFVDQLWEDLMSTTASALGTHGRNASTAHAPRGSSPRSRAVPPLQRDRRWGIAQVATAAMLLVTLGLGYLTLGSLRPRSERPPSIPAVAPAAATPEAAGATPTIPPVSRVGHPIVGAWQWDYDPCAPGTTTSYAVFDVDGTYIEYDDFSGIAIGTWRATGERTAELVTVVQQPVSLAFMFEPDYALPPSTLAGNVVTTWQAIRIDAAGNRLTSAGYYEPRAADGSINVHLEYGDECTYELLATRMVVDPAAPEVTPAAR